MSTAAFCAAEVKMYLVPFYTLFPELAWAETRSITLQRHPILPDDEYSVIEAYCTDPKCNCRRVMLNVIGLRQGNEYLAAISFGFDRRKPDAGPFLDPMNPQSKYAPALLRLVATEILSDPAYVARLERHYRKSKGARPQSPHQLLGNAGESQGAEDLSPQPARPNEGQRVARGRPRPQTQPNEGQRVARGRPRPPKR